ncbi:MAG: GNAT family N-acetyltransferase [Actinomycetota bacterium]
MVIATDGDLVIREMRDDPADYLLLVRWRAEPHVHEWWDPDDPAPTIQEVLAEYGPRVRGDEKTTACIIEVDGRPAGYAQFYRWHPWEEAETELDIRADPDTFGLDIHIGEPDMIDRGLGSWAVDLVCRHLEDDLGASWVALTTEITNHRAQHAYEKVGFVKVRQVLDTDTRDGQRTVCWLMERRHG